MSETKESKCLECGDTGGVTCCVCYGHCDEMCIDCDGSGECEDGTRCEECEGTGETQCEECGGFGLVTCEKCSNDSR